jgi:magnesium-transporting ATPase (P-type)
MVLSRCVQQSLLSPARDALQTATLTETDISEIIRGVITPMAQQSLRTIAVAYRDFPNRAMLPPSVEECPEQDLRLYGILGIKDPLRKGVPEAVEIAARAGVRVRMVTGDNKITASAIAKECGILRHETDIVMEGPVFRTLTPKQLDQILPRLVVLARSSPKDKMILVRRLNGNLPTKKEEWAEDHPDDDWETQRDVVRYTEGPCVWLLCCVFDLWLCGGGALSLCVCVCRRPFT